MQFQGERIGTEVPECSECGRRCCVCGYPDPEGINIIKSMKRLLIYIKALIYTIRLERATKKFLSRNSIINLCSLQVASKHSGECLIKLMQEYEKSCPKHN